MTDGLTALKPSPYKANRLSQCDHELQIKRIIYVILIHSFCTMYVILECEEFQTSWSKQNGKKSQQTHSIRMFILNGRFKQTHLNDAIASKRTHSVHEQQLPKQRSAQDYCWYLPTYITAIRRYAYDLYAKSTNANPT